MDWPTAGSVVGGVAIIVGGVVKIFGGSAKRDESKRDDEILTMLLKNQSDQTKNQAEQTRILDRLSILIEHRDTRTEELHRDTHAKLDRVANNQDQMIEVVRAGFGNLRLAK